MMNNFKKQIQSDLDNVFFNTEEFADVCLLNNKYEFKGIVLDEIANMLNITDSSITLLLMNCDLEKYNIKRKDTILINNKEYYVKEVHKKINGVSRILLGYDA